MVEVMTAAKYFCAAYADRYGEDIDQMKVHKLLYLAQRESLVRTRRPLFPEGLYAWQYGPVVKEVRKAFLCGVLPVKDVFPVLGKEIAVILSFVFDKYACKSSWSLSRLTHEEYSWKHARRDVQQGGGDRLMSMGDMLVDADRIRRRRMFLSLLPR